MSGRLLVFLSFSKSQGAGILHRKGDAMAKENKPTILNTQPRDSSSKLIFGDNILCSQFLRNYADMDILKNIRPEDLEDVSERYVPLLGEERESDTVKKVNIGKYLPTKEDGNSLDLSLYIVSLIEHKTKVEYNVSMQILRYMLYIWEDYEKEMEKRYPYISDRKEFRYPPVFPIVYYEGTGRWTASRDLADRILCKELLSDYLPHFKYQVVSLHDYSNKELLDKGDEISLAMLINKIRCVEDMEAFTQLSDNQINKILKDTPEYLLGVMEKLTRVLLYSMNLEVEKTEKAVAKIKERKMGRLFEGVTFDFQAAKREMEEEARAKARAEVRAEVETTERELRIAKYIIKMLINSHSEKEIQEALQKEFGLSEKEAEEKYQAAVM
ncbi:MAG: Rpn family recombination-promoting nuclease/putative transposase [Lachnospiraceae bacterium]|nr:Rpn family recombination-promoting nuclease/putative transposase [Lachnospiraceae bacterium]